MLLGGDYSTNSRLCSWRVRSNGVKVAAMENTFGIIWVAKGRDRWGLGTNRFSKEEAEALATELNEDHGAFLHRAIDTATEDQAAVLSAMKSSGSAEEAQSVSYPNFVAAQAACVVPKPLMPEPKENVISLTALFPVLPAAGD
jgi:hypothetical protein